MDDRPYVVLSCAISVDGCLDDASPARLMLSSDADFDRVDAVRASCDAILIGANTIRRDNPRLVLRSGLRQAARLARGEPPDPAKVTITRTGDLDPAARFFTLGDADKLVYAATSAAATLRARLRERATVVDVGEAPDLAAILTDLARRNVRRLMVEGGGEILTWFLASRLADELQLSVAPLLVGEPTAPRWVRPGVLPRHRMRLLETRPVDDCVLLRYALAPESDRLGGDGG